jgi:hypothetical protein
LVKWALINWSIDWAIDGSIGSRRYAWIKMSHNFKNRIQISRLINTRKIRA